MAPVATVPTPQELLDQVKNPAVAGQDIVAAAELARLGYHELSAWAGELVKVANYQAA